MLVLCFYSTATCTTTIDTSIVVLTIHTAVPKVKRAATISLTTLIIATTTTATATSAIAVSYNTTITTWKSSEIAQAVSTITPVACSTTTTATCYILDIATRITDATTTFSVFVIAFAIGAAITTRTATKTATSAT